MSWNHRTGTTPTCFRKDHPMDMPTGEDCKNSRYDGCHDGGYVRSALR